MNPTVAIVAQGAMGAAIGRRLAERGLSVVTSLEGRSAASAARAREAGMIAVSDREAAQADMFLSILPPSEALALAQKMAGHIGVSNKKPVYVDCNAVSPQTKVKIGQVVAGAGAPFVDVSILGLPPREGYDGPMLLASGPDTARFTPLAGFGMKIRTVEGPVGAASAVKMSFAGITKGITALGSMVMLAASRHGIADEMRKEIERAYPQFLGYFGRAVPDMYNKAYRFVGEMEEIADFVGEDPAARQMYLAFADFYTRIAADYEGPREEVGALSAFLGQKQ